MTEVKEKEEEEEEEERKQQNADQGHEEAGYEGVKPNCKSVEPRPTKKEVYEHMIAHTPYRSWCPPLRSRKGQSIVPQTSREMISTCQW